MKKIVGFSMALILGVGVFFASDKQSTNSNLDLSSLMSLNLANAECNNGLHDTGVCTWTGRCRFAIGEEENCDPNFSG